MRVSLFASSTITSRAIITTLFPSLPCRTITSITDNYCRYPLVARNLSYSIRYPNQFKAPSFCSCRAMSPSVQVKEKIELTEKEKMIFDQLMATVRHFNLPTQLRVAGGWVRDKLLGKGCYDIDIALDDMLGSTFADKVSQYLASIGEEPQGRGVIPSNPDQSKHLETATMRLHGVQIDFVNLRSEKYSENSRIPTQMEFGTAEEDAYRRDLTINSLFYNINTLSVEDLTGRGIEDLKSGKIVTPLPPKETFLDDPLRVLRAIRFGARFRFQLDDELQTAAASDDVKNALAAKISRERIGAEIDLMVSGNDPVEALRYIYSLQLFWVVFSLPPKYEPELPEECDRLCLAYADFAKDLLELIGASTFTDEQWRLCLYSALFVPIRKVTYKNKKSKETPVVDHIMRTSLKRKSSDTDTVIGIQNASEKFLPLMPFLKGDTNQPLNELFGDGEFVGIDASSKLRVSVGLLLREIQVWWRVALLIAVLSYPSGIDCYKGDSDKRYLLKERKQVFEAVENTIFQLGLDNIWSLDPLVKGKDIMNMLQLKGGPVVGELQRRALSWQLAHPAGTSEECMDWLRETHQKRVKLN